jgi:hypothetical protein
MFYKFVVLTYITQCILSNSVLCILSCNITYSYASDTAPIWHEDGPEGPKHVAIK